MNNLGYQVNIFYDKHLGYYIATMPELPILNISGTASNYTTALSNLLANTSAYVGTFPVDTPLGWVDTY